MLASIMSAAPRANPYYASVRPAAERWAIDVLRLDAREANRFREADFSYMAALWAPDADAEALRTVVDWLHWVFFFDDRFDEGDLKDGVGAAGAEAAATLTTMEDGAAAVDADGGEPLRYVFQYTWFCFRKRASAGLRRRYKRSMKDYCDGLVRQVGVRSESIAVDVREYMDFRSSTIAVYPSQELVEYAQGIELPMYVFDHNAMIRLRRISSDMTLLRDLELGVEQNIIHVYRKKGLSEQQAVDAVGGMFDKLYKDWYLVLSEMPCWGETVDREILKHVCGCRDLGIGNIYWSFSTGRYLGKEGEIVRKTRILELP